MEKQFPKNVRQIGNVSDVPKIYVEDYVDTFLNQLCDKAVEEPVGAFLVGQAIIQEEQECVYISGAIQMKELDMVGPDVSIGEHVFADAKEIRKEFFEENEIIGWFLTMPGQALGMNSNLRKLHEKHFAKNNHIFIMKDPVEKDEIYFAYKYKELMQMGGHFIYYERNPCMQNYMITQRKKIGVTPSEMVTDKAAKDFRSIINNRLSENSRNQSTRWTYAASTFLVLVVLIIGVTMINNYDKMQSVQSALDDIRASVSGGDNKDSVKVTANVTDQMKEEGKTQSGENEQKPEENTEDQSGTNVETPSDDVNNTEKTSGTPTGTTSTYTVVLGDTLSKISMKIYGDREHVEAIRELNEISGNNVIYEGQKLLLP